MHATEKNGCRTSYFRVFGTLRQNWDLIGTITGLWGLSPNFGTLLKALIKHFFFSRKEGSLLEGAQRIPSYGACDHIDGEVDIEAGIAGGL